MVTQTDKDKKVQPHQPKLDASENSSQHMGAVEDAVDPRKPPVQALDKLNNDTEKHEPDHADDYDPTDEITPG